MSEPIDLEIRAFNRIWNDDIALFVRGFVREDGNISQRVIGRSIVFEPVNEGLYEPNPTLAIDLRAGQQLIDELWNCGLRPSQGKQSEGVTAAQTRHLEDMRAIAFDKLKVERPTANPLKQQHTTGRG